MAVQAKMYAENLGIPLCGSQDWCGCGGGDLRNNDDFACNLQHLQHPQQSQQVQNWQQIQNQQQQCLLLPQQLQTQQQRNQCSSAFDNNFVFSAMKSQPTTSSTALNQNNNMAMGLSQIVVAHIERQRQEIDIYINLQSQRLKLELQEQRKQELATLFRKLEAKAGTLLRQKDEEIAQARKRTTELEDFMKRMEMEGQSWKRVAGENKAMIANLNTCLQQLRDKAPINFQQQQQDPSNVAVEDAESCCHVNNGEEDEEEEDKLGMTCRACRCKNSSVLFLPCRHLCCCTSCEAFLGACPVCKSPKRGTIEALIS